jgi:monoamine oxidase
LINSILFEPNLPENIIQLANKTHTWMGESIKFSVEYKTPFGKKRLFWNLIQPSQYYSRMYDHSTADNSGFALKDF